MTHVASVTEVLMLILEMLTWLGVGLVLGAFKIHHQQGIAPVSRTAQLRMLAVGACGGMLGGVVGRPVLTNGPPFSGYSIMALVLAIIVSLFALSLFGMGSTGTRRALGGGES